MRPHVELIQEKDLVWHEAELHKGSGRARQRNLSYDEENGAASTRVVFDKAWSRAGGYHHADVEWYVMKGRVKLGDQVVLLGAQGDDEITADEWAERLGTISYEVVCGFGPRMSRRYRS